MGTPEPPTGPPRALEENVEVIKTWEQALLHQRSRAEQLSDWITRAVASGPVLLAHVAWFSLWIAANAGAVPGVAPFDLFPFPLLTMVVSLEAIFLALFVLASQNRLGRLSDRRAHLDLQIDLLSEREMTAVLQLLLDIASHLKVRQTLTSEQIHDLVAKTDLPSLTRKMDELTSEEPSDTCNGSDAHDIDRSAREQAVSAGGIRRRTGTADTWRDTARLR